MNEFYIPTNFEDSGKLLELFGIRNVVEGEIFFLSFCVSSIALKLAVKVR